MISSSRCIQSVLCRVIVSTRPRGPCPRLCCVWAPVTQLYPPHSSSLSLHSTAGLTPQRVSPIPAPPSYPSPYRVPLLRPPCLYQPRVSADSGSFLPCLPMSPGKGEYRPANPRRRREHAARRNAYTYKPCVRSREHCPRLLPGHVTMRSHFSWSAILLLSDGSWQPYLCSHCCDSLLFVCKE